MKKLLYLLIFSILIFASCRNETKKSNDINSNIEIADTIQTNDFLESDLYKCICSYINTSIISFIEGFPLYINLYFFQNILLIILRFGKIFRRPTI
jgi:hypothetical protein